MTQGRGSQGEKVGWATVNEGSLCPCVCGNPSPHTSDSTSLNQFSHCGHGSKGTNID